MKVQNATDASIKVTDDICTGWWGCRPYEKYFFSLQGTVQNFKRLQSGSIATIIFPNVQV